MLALNVFNFQYLCDLKLLVFIPQTLPTLHQDTKGVIKRADETELKQNWESLFHVFIHSFISSGTWFLESWSASLGHNKVTFVCKIA